MNKKYWERLIQYITKKKLSNPEYLRRLVKEMYRVSDFPELDRYGSVIFEREVRGTWKLFRFITNMAIPGIFWFWNQDLESVVYPDSVEVTNFEEFATVVLHEACHGWCYFHMDDPRSRIYPGGVEEEEVCWNVSKMVCEKLGIAFQQEIADLCYQYYSISENNHTSPELEVIKQKLPMHLK